jgi:hypothetical protein
VLNDEGLLRKRWGSLETSMAGSVALCRPLRQRCMCRRHYRLEKLHTLSLSLFSPSVVRRYNQICRRLLSIEPEIGQKLQDLLNIETALPRYSPVAQPHSTGTRHMHADRPEITST